MEIRLAMDDRGEKITETEPLLNVTMTVNMVLGIRFLQERAADFVGRTATSSQPICIPLGGLR